MAAANFAATIPTEWARVVKGHADKNTFEDPRAIVVAGSVHFRHDHGRWDRVTDVIRAAFAFWQIDVGMIGFVVLKQAKQVMDAV